MTRALKNRHDIPLVTDKQLQFNMLADCFFMKDNGTLPAFPLHSNKHLKSANVSMQPIHTFSNNISLTQATSSHCF